MILFQFRNADVSETAFAQDRDDLVSLLAEQYGACIATIADDNGRCGTRATPTCSRSTTPSSGASVRCASR